MGSLSVYDMLRRGNVQVPQPGSAPASSTATQQNAQQPADNAIQQTAVSSQQPQQQAQQPQVDTSDPINSLANMLVTPAEREAQEQRMLKNKRRMIAWTGLFDGLRNLANLWAVSKGASPMKFTDNPYQQIEHDYQAERQRQDALYKNQDAYAKQLWTLQRQANEDARKKALSAAQARYYDTRDEMARLKGENDRLKAEEQTRLSEARRKQVEQKTKQMEELHPLQKEKLKAVIKNTLHNANRPYGRSGGSRGSSLSNDPFEELGQLLVEQPEVIGPILEQQGLGFYDKDSKKFNFTKNPTKGMATTATRRAAGKKTTGTGTRGSLLPGTDNKNTKTGGSLLPK